MIADTRPLDRAVKKPEEAILKPLNRKLKAKIRYSHSGSMCKVTRTGEDQIHCVFEEPVRAVTPGQAVVLYDGDYVAGGGIII